MYKNSGHAFIVQWIWTRSYLNHAALPRDIRGV